MPFGRRHRRVLRVAAGRKRVRRRVGNDVAPAASAGPRAAASRATIAYSGWSGPDLLRAVHPQDDLVREPVRPEVGDRGEQEADASAPGAAERLADEQQQRAQRAEEQRRLHSVGHGSVKAGVSATPADQSIYVVHAGAVPRPAPPPTGGFKDVLPGYTQVTRFSRRRRLRLQPRGRTENSQPPSRRPSHQVTQTTALKPPAPRFCLARIVLS